MIEMRVTPTPEDAEIFRQRMRRFIASFRTSNRTYLAEMQRFCGDYIEPRPRDV